jgi:LCP family protein required for cell wall assembly
MAALPWGICAYERTKDSVTELTRRDLAAVRRGATATKPLRHARLKRHRAYPSVLRFIAAAVAVVVASSVSLGAFTAYQFGQKVSSNAFALPSSKDGSLTDVGNFAGGFNVLIVGADNSPTQGDAYGARGGTLNDVNILLHVAADHKSATAVSIPRDLIIAQPSCTNADTGVVASAVSAQPLNVAYSRGGTPCVVKTVEALTGLTIPYAAQFTFRAVVQMTDAIGGVTVCLANDIVDPKANLNLKAGLRTLKGKNALGFLRTRHGVGDGSDLSRISVQQIYLSALARKIKSSDTLTNPVKLYNLANAAVSYVHLSQSLTSLDTMVAMARTLRTINLEKLNFIQYPGSTGDARYPGKVVPNVAQATILFNAIKADKPVRASQLGRGSETDESSAPAIATSTAKPTKTPSATPTKTPTKTPVSTPNPTATPTPTSTLETVQTTGQQASQTTCARGYLK